MRHAFPRKTFAAGLGLLFAAAAAPIALADAPGSYFVYPNSSANAPVTPSATDVQIAAANRKADQALATAQQALREAQAASASRQSAMAGTPPRERSRPIVDGHHVQPRRDESGADGLDNGLFQEIIRNAAR